VSSIFNCPSLSERVALQGTKGQCFSSYLVIYVEFTGSQVKAWDWESKNASPNLIGDCDKPIFVQWGLESIG